MDTGTDAGRRRQNLEVPPRKTYVTRRANDVLRDAGISGPPVSIQVVCRLFGTTLVPVASWPTGSHSAQWDPRSREISFNKNEPDTRQRFSIGHELGHALLKHTAMTFSSSADPESWEYADNEVEALEAEANQFARELLMPRAWLEADLKTGMRIPDLAARYRVSQDAMGVALSAYRLI